jgi:uncharacterized protein YyaL (SSP411 family)
VEQRTGVWGGAAVLIGLLAALPAGPSAGADPAPARNRLAQEASPYLRMHASNPVEWYPWGEEAFARARAESKPVFLSVGYSTCYWCHVMEREVFSDPEIAAYMNRWFVNVKVDREERPDIDEVYMTATRLLRRGGGGWPNSLFLTPGGEPFYAGTYFPPIDAPGRPGFPRVLRSIVESWKENRLELQRSARRVTEAIARERESTASVALPHAPELMWRARDELARGFEPEHGGFSPRIKFPRPSALDLLLELDRTGDDPETRRLLVVTLDEMALGGIYDHLGGGFHRYSTEPTWSIPHFEKMLYDNAQLVSVYARAWRQTRRELYRHVAEDVVRYLAAEMRHPEGAFYSAQDAEVGHEEGASYVWSRDEIEAVLGAGASASFFEVYELAPMREHPGKGVLRVRLPLEPQLEAAGVAEPAALLARHASSRERLLEARGRRPQPLRDDKVLVAWNGLAIRGMVDAGQALDRPDLIELAAVSARFLLERLRSDDGGLFRSYSFGQARERGVLDDYAYLIDGLLALWEATGEPEWLEAARDLADQMLARFEDPLVGGFYLAEADHDLIVRPRRALDGALPSGNGVAVQALRELAQQTGDTRYSGAAERTVSALSEDLSRYPSSLSSLVVALHAPAAARVSASGRPPAQRPSRLPRSADHVRVELRARDGGLVVELEIDAGWHVNANPASLAFLVPTTLALEGAEAAEPVYPSGVDFRPEFAPVTLRVYAGRVEIPVRLGAGAPEVRAVSVRYQACDDRSCLPPSSTRVERADPSPR